MPLESPPRRVVQCARLRRYSRGSILRQGQSAARTIVPAGQCANRTSVPYRRIDQRLWYRAGSRGRPGSGGYLQIFFRGHRHRLHRRPAQGAQLFGRLVAVQLRHPAPGHRHDLAHGIERLIHHDRYRCQQRRQALDDGAGGRRGDRTRAVGDKNEPQCIGAEFRGEQRVGDIGNSANFYAQAASYFSKIDYRRVEAVQPRVCYSIDILTWFFYERKPGGACRCFQAPFQASDEGQTGRTGLRNRMARFAQL